MFAKDTNTTLLMRDQSLFLFPSHMAYGRFIKYLYLCRGVEVDTSVYFSDYPYTLHFLKLLYLQLIFKKHTINQNQQPQIDVDN